MHFGTNAPEGGASRCVLLGDGPLDAEGGYELGCGSVALVIGAAFALGATHRLAETHVFEGDASWIGKRNVARCGVA